MRYAFGSYEQAWKALKAARYILPDTYWFITNEGGRWVVVEGRAE